MKSKNNFQELVLNKNLEINQIAKETITSAERSRYTYFDYSRENIEKIASKKEKITLNEAHSLAQALFPDYLICSGLFDCFLMFEIKNGARVDPPLYCYSNLDSYLNNNAEKKYNHLATEIKDLFIKNNIEWGEFWEEYFANCGFFDNKEA